MQYQTPTSFAYVHNASWIQMTSHTMFNSWLALCKTRHLKQNPKAWTMLRWCVSCLVDPFARRLLQGLCLLHGCSPKGMKFHTLERLRPDQQHNNNYPGLLQRASCWYPNWPWETNWPWDKNPYRRVEHWFPNGHLRIFIQSLWSPHEVMC